MDFSKIYNKTSDWASSAAKRSKKFIVNQTNHMFDEHAAQQHPSGTASAPAGPSTAPSLPQKMLRIEGLELRFLKLLDEGGFSYVYATEDVRTGNSYAVKRLLVQDEDTLKLVKKEIKIMKKLGKHPNIIGFVATKEVNKSRSRSIYIVMEMAKTGLIQLMQKRLDRKRNFSEKEVFTIFHDVCLAVEAMHRLSPPLQHRDLKVENVLRVGNTFKLCDFGSASTQVYQLDTKADRARAEEDINKNTTLAYRAPEMCDMYSEFPITEKSDIWALGCILYKLCFFNGPFEDAAAEGSYLPIINCKYTFPNQHNYSDDIISFIRDLLEVNVDKRPDIWQVLDRVAKLRGVDNKCTPPNRSSKSTSSAYSTSARAPTSSVESKSSNLVGSRSTKKKKKKDLFDLLGADGASSPSKPAVRKNRSTPTPKSQSTNNTSVAATFDNDSDWDANFDDDDAFGEEDPFGPQSSNGPPSSSSVASPKNTSNSGGEPNIFDDLDWEAPSSPQTSQQQRMIQSQHQRSMSGDFTQHFSGLGIHDNDQHLSPMTQKTPTRPKSTDNMLSNDDKKNSILATMDQAHQQRPHHHAARGHQRFHSYDVSGYHNGHHQMHRPQQQQQFHTPQRPMQGQGFYPQQHQQSMMQQQASLQHSLQVPSQHVNPQHTPQHQHTRSMGSMGSNPTSSPSNNSDNPFDALFD